MTMIQCGFLENFAQSKIDKHQEIQPEAQFDEVIDISIDGNLALISSKGGRLPNEITYTF